MNKSSRKQCAISLKVKMDLLKAVDVGDSSKTVICKRFGIANSTLSMIIKKRDQLTALFDRSMFEPDRKRLRTAKHEHLEAALLVWYKQAKSQNIPMSGPILLEKADVFAVKMGIKFTAYPGWLERFKKRNGIVLKNICNETIQDSSALTLNWLQYTLPAVLEEYNARDIFNADEMGLFYSCLPDKSILVEGQHCPGGKKHKDRITVMVACNSDGSEKLPLFVIGRNVNPRSFKNVKKLPVDYVANNTAWMTSAIFTDWILNLDKQFLREKRKIAMLVDNCPAHAEVRLQAIRLIMLPSSTITILQPCNQGIILNLKHFYRKQLLRKYLAAIEASEDFSVNLLDALHMLRTAWDLVSPRTIDNCFRHTGFSKMTDLIPDAEDSQEAEPTLNEIFELISGNIECSVSLDEFVAIDDNLCTAPMLTDKDILEMVRPTDVHTDSKDSDNIVENEIDLTLPVPTTTEMRNCVKSIRRYLDVHSNGEMNHMVDAIEQFIENKIINSMTTQLQC